MLRNLFISLLVLASHTRVVVTAPHNSAGSVDRLVKAAAPEHRKCKKTPAALALDNAQTPSTDPRMLPAVTFSMDPAVSKLLETKEVVLSPANYHLPPGVPGIILQATYFFMCRLTGPHSRRFVWAAHHGPGHDLNLVAVHHVDNFVNAHANVPGPGDYRAVWVAVWELAYESLCCRYFASGHFEGTSFDAAVTMSLINLDGPLGRIPHVSENCYAGDSPPNHPGHSCSISHVHVEQL